MDLGGIGILLSMDDLKAGLKQFGFSVALNGMMQETADTCRLVNSVMREHKKGIIEIDGEQYDLAALKRYTICQLDSLRHLVAVLIPQNEEEQKAYDETMEALHELRAEVLGSFPS